MPNIKSAKKRVELSKVYAARNQAAKSELKTSIKKFDAALEVGGEAATSAYKAAVQHVDRAAQQGILHKNTAARKKSALTVKLNQASK